MLRVRAAVLLLLVGVLAPAASGSEGDPVLASAAGSGPRWAVATVQSDGARVASRLDVSAAATPLALSARLYVDGVRQSTTNVVLRATGGRQGVRLEAPDVAGVRLSLDRTRDDSDFRFGDVSFTLEVNPDRPVHRGRLSLVLYAAADDVALWRWSVTGAPGTTLLGTGTGAEAFAHEARDFGGSDTSLYAAETVSGVATASVRSNSGAVRAVALTPRFVGAFHTPGTDRLSVRGPGGYARDCTSGCGFELEPGTRLGASGTYSFGLDGSSAGLRGPGGLQVADTDVTLHGAQPRPPLGAF